MATHVNNRRRGGLTTLLRVVAAISMIAGICLTTVGMASTASADSGICDGSNGYTKSDSSGTVTGAFGSFTWSTSSPTLSYNVLAGYSVEFCLKAGSEESSGSDVATVKTVSGPSTGSFGTSSGKDVSHVGYKVTATPPTDVCSNLEGNQASVPEGYTESEGVCTPTPPPPTDVCSNIEGNQASVPEGYTESEGVCTPTPPPPTDVCSNIEGNQASVPEGYTATNGVCTQDQTPPPPTDVCSNLEGNQASVPDGYTATNGTCAQVEGTDETADPTPPSDDNGTDAEVEGTSASRAPAVKGASAAVAGTSAAVPNAIDAGLVGAQTDVRLLVGEGLLGAGLLFFAASLWSGLGVRRRGGVQA